MAKKMLIDATHSEETRVVVLDGAKVDEFDFESVSKRQLAGNIYLAKVTRVEPSLQAAFVEYGGNRHGFLAFSEIHPDYYQIPMADREALLAEEEAAAKAEESRARAREKIEDADEPEDDEDDGEGGRNRRRSRRGGRTRRKRADVTEIGLDQSEDPRDGVDPRDVVATPVEAEAPADLIAEPMAAPIAEPVAETPAKMPVEVPAEAPAEVPAQSPAEAPAAAPIEAPIKAPTEQPDTETETERPGRDGPVTMLESTGLDDEHVEEPFDASEDEDEEAETDDAETGGAESGRARSRTRSRSRRGGRTRRGRDDEDASSDDDGDQPEAPEETGGAADDRVDDIAPRRMMRARRYKIQEVIKVRQIMLVQVVKEERGNKGAALTTYLSLAGRYCVLMPNTARGGGISRKITNAADRKKLKEIAGELEVPRGMGLIVRTAGARRTKAEIKRDYEFLLRQWEKIRDLTLRSVAPALIYEEGSLIKRSIRDLFSGDIDQILVEGETGYTEAHDYMSMLMPDHVNAVVRYDEGSPLFTRYQVETELNSMFNPVVQLKSGGYIVIGITEALVAVDVNSGKSTKEGSIEDTALKTNLEAADEVARQMRLRDLAGLIVIDFIDMEESRNNRSVEKRVKDALKNDRARIQCGRISSFGLMEMSRQRLRPGMLEATTAPCAHCHGTGIVRSPESMALAILRALEEEGQRGRAPELLVKAPVDVANWLMNQKREHLMRIEARCDITVRIEADPMLVTPQHSVERIKTPQRTRQPYAVGAAVTASDVYAQVGEEMDADLVEAYVAEPEIEAPVVEIAIEVEAKAPVPAALTPEEDEANRKRRGRRGGRRRRRRNGEEDDDQSVTDAEGEDAPEDEADMSVDATPLETEAETEAEDEDEEAPVDAQAVTGDAAAAALPSPKRSRRRRKVRRDTPEDGSAALAIDDDDADLSDELPEDEASDDAEAAPEHEVVSAPAPMAAPEPEVVAAPAPMAAPEPEVVAAPTPVAVPEPEVVAAPTPMAAPEPVAVSEPEVVIAPALKAVPEPEVVAAPEPVATPEPEVVATPEPTLAPVAEAPADAAEPAKRRGWWSRG
jgi:ribonuclease E